MMEKNGHNPMCSKEKNKPQFSSQGGRSSRSSGGAGALRGGGTSDLFRLLLLLQLLLEQLLHVKTLTPSDNMASALGRITFAHEIDALCDHVIFGLLVVKGNGFAYSQSDER